MSDIKTKAIVLTSKDYKEKDKMIWLFSLENGLITAIAKSVRTENAKLKFAKEPFCFGDFLINVGNQKTVIGLDVIDTFFDITKDYDKFVTATTIINLVKNSIYENSPNEKLFICLLKTLRELAYESTKTEYVLIKFILEYLFTNGVKLNLTTCSSCNSDLSLKRFFDASTGEMFCSACASKSVDEVLAPEYNVLKLLNNCEYSQLKNMKLPTVSVAKCLAFLQKTLKLRFNMNINYV